jgi:hypothetical protein
MPAPTAAPGIAVSSSIAYYVARADVTRGGYCYNAPPSVTFSTPVWNSTTTPTTQPAGYRPAKALSYLNQSSVAEVRVTDSGKYYPKPPSVELGDSYGKGAALTAFLDIPDSALSDPTNSPFTGITQWEVITAPSAVADDGSDDYKTWYCAFNGRYSGTTTAGNNYLGYPSFGGLWFFPYGTSLWGYGFNVSTNAGRGPLTYVVSGTQSGTGARIGFTFSGAQFYGGPGSAGKLFFYGARSLASVKPARFGYGYADSDVITIKIPAASGDATRDIYINGYPTGSSLNTAAPRYSVKSIQINTVTAGGVTTAVAGSGYTVAPQLKIVSNSGFGAYATCVVTDGKITSISLENGGSGYKTPPTVEVVSGGAEVFPLARPHLRGKYQCYYRFVDGTPAANGGPLVSVLSPVKEADAGNGTDKLTWTIPAVPLPANDPAVGIEIWRSTGDQALTLYKVATVTSGATTFVDDLTDDELRDPDRSGYAAMPIVLPNGELNAMRFVPPPTDKSAVVLFQDRYWYAVDTGGNQPNTILYSEVDEPDSVPAINEVIVQQSSGDNDSIRAIIPFGSTLLLMQSRHVFSLMFAKNPVLDAQITPVGYRGALNQRCWDIHEGVCYVMDRYGIYAIDPSGQIESLTDGIANMFRDDIDMAKTTWNFVTVDPRTRTLKAFVVFSSDLNSASTAPYFPTRALCYCIPTKSWHIETFPQRLTGATRLALNATGDGDFRSVYAGRMGAYAMDVGGADVGYGAVISVSLANRGTGYGSDTKVSISSSSAGCGAEFQPSINGKGEITAIWITNPGFGYSAGSLAITGSGTEASATYAVCSTQQSIAPTYRLKTGAAAYQNDAANPKAGVVASRQVRLYYKPQPATCQVAMRLYYNNSALPRPNVAPRDRGAGFRLSTIDSGSRLDIGAATPRYGSDDGVASTALAGRTVDDMNGTDRAVSVEIIGARMNSDPVVIYDLEVDGTGGK